MKTRVIVSLIAVPIIVLMILFAPFAVFGCFVGLISCFAAIEFLRCAEKGLNTRLIVYSAVISAAIPVMTALDMSAFAPHVIFLFIVALTCELIASFRLEKPMDYETVGSCVLAGVVMPMLISSAVRLGAGENAPLYVLIPFIITFSCDSGAYFTGAAFGRHKLTMKLSPNKTIEGAIGGFFSSILMMTAYGFILISAGYASNLPVMAIFGFLGGLLCQIGDLFFSAIKRACGVKDFGKMIPGHGGVLDRFDSMYFVAPLIEFLILWTPPMLQG